MQIAGSQTNQPVKEQNLEPRTWNLEPDARTVTSGRVVEFVSVYFLLPAALTALRVFVWHRLPVIPVLWLAAIPAAIWLSRQGVTRKEVFGSTEQLRALPPILLRAALIAIPLVVAMYVLFRDAFFALPRRNTGFWGLIMVCYPLLSVFPQGLLYRGLFYRRYGVIFAHPALRRLMAALSFSFCHCFFLNAWALVFTFVGGLFFSRTYERTGSMFVSNFEHAVYGDLLFTIGYGGLFLYHGTMALMS